jgi:HD-GYP domain-containing protein (c-di-GMP phosphodiesterase class II)
VIPLKKGNKVLGILSLQRYKLKAYDDKAFESILLLADQCAVALERSFAQSKLREREEMLQRQLSKTTALRNIDLSITSTLDVRVNLSVLLQQLVNELKVDAAVILLMNPVTGVMQFMEGIGFRTRALQYTRLRIGEGLAGKAALTRSIVSVPDLRTHPSELSQIPAIINERFVMYMGIPLIAKGQVKGVLEIFHRRLLTPDQEWQDFLEALATQAAIAIDNASLFDNLQRSNLELLLAYDTTLEGWSRAMDLRDKETEGHTRRVTEKTLELAQTMNISEKELGNIRWGSLLHDMGKMGIPDSILLKPGPLTDEEWVIMKKHPVYAYELLSPIAYLRPALDIPYCHHEKWDGTGYPRGIQGDTIPLSARIFSIVDVWDALTSDRPYRKAWSAEKTKEYILSISGTQFDPQVVENFMKLNW